MDRYTILLNILDKIRYEAANTKFAQKYLPHETEPEAINQARARAFIHLYLKVGFGLLGFEERERHITDGTNDGGVDGYYLDPTARTGYFIQSKFRATQANFSNKEITLEEILVMDIDRILNGDNTDERGNEYNGKIKQLQRDIANTEGIGRFKYRVIILANLTGVTPSQLRRLAGNYDTEVIDHERCYEDLVFPVISGTYFNASDLNILIDLSNKNAGAKISYTVTTKHGECDITALFVPILEIAKVLHKYKNSILRYNPRSYLEFEGQKVNTAIRDTVLHTTTNEFALFNNGITMLSDETYINERIGQKNKAQLSLKNPQIINGGQTAYTLSRIYEEHPNDAFNVFEGKEVLLKVITLVDHETQRRTAAQKIDLIDQISTATNQQTVVITADRFSNEPAHHEIQSKLFERFGLLYERKRGEFADGIHKGYIQPESVLERNRFFRIFLASQGDVKRAIEKRLFVKYQNPRQTIEDDTALNKFYFAYLCYKKLAGQSAQTPAHKRELETYAKLYALTIRYVPDNPREFPATIARVMPIFNEEWRRFITGISQTNTRFLRTITDRQGQQHKIFNVQRWITDKSFVTDLAQYFAAPAETASIISHETLSGGSSRLEENQN